MMDSDRMRVVYVAGKFTGANGWEVARNIRRAESWGFAVAEAGAMPFIPHANTASFHNTLTDAFWYQGTLEMLRRCDAIILVPGWEDSKGALAEVAEAKKLNMPIFTGVGPLRTWLAQTAKEIANG